MSGSLYELQAVPTTQHQAYLICIIGAATDKGKRDVQDDTFVRKELQNLFSFLTLSLAALLPPPYPTALGLIGPGKKPV